MAVMFDERHSFSVLHFNGVEHTEWISRIDGLQEKPIGYGVYELTETLNTAPVITIVLGMVQHVS